MKQDRSFSASSGSDQEDQWEIIVEGHWRAEGNNLVIQFTRVKLGENRLGQEQRNELVRELQGLEEIVTRKSYALPIVSVSDAVLITRDPNNGKQCVAHRVK